MPAHTPPPPGNGDADAEADRAYRMLRQLAALAIQITLEAPAKFKGPGYFTYVQRETVTRIRNVLDAHGVDWRTQHKLARAKK